MDVQFPENRMIFPMPVVGHNRYPRVLIVNLSCINTTDQFGISIRNWFAEWPKENLAQIYSGGETAGNKFCGTTYKLGPSDRFLGKIFFRLKGSSLGINSQPTVLNENQRALKQLSPMGLIYSQIGKILLNSGLWELLFHPILSDHLVQWVKEFGPDVIYCQGYTLSFAWLPIMLEEQMGIPICFQTGDDWPVYLYKNSIFAWLMRPIVQKAVKDLVTLSTKRFANGDRMASEYTKRYNVPFEKIMIGDDMNRFKSAKSFPLVENGKISIIYTGNLGQGRWESLADLCLAAKILSTEGLDIVVFAFVSAIPPEANKTLLNLENLKILPGLPHDLVPAYLKGADILFIPETFDSTLAEAIRYSLSTKATLYMMSERPILVYASPITGIMDYAKREKWAFVVDERRQDLLVNALRKLILDNDLKTSLIQIVREVSLRNHDEKKVRQKFLEAIQSIVRERRG